MKDLMAKFWKVDRKLLFETLKNNIILHQHQVCCNFNLTMNTNMGDWVKTQNTTWYSHFFMIEYDNKKWVEHFRMGRKFIVQIIEKRHEI
jgi:hypothetical protein